MAYRTPPFISPFAIVSIVLALGATNVVVNKTTHTVNGAIVAMRINPKTNPVQIHLMMNRIVVPVVVLTRMIRTAAVLIRPVVHQVQLMIRVLVPLIVVRLITIVQRLIRVTMMKALLLSHQVRPRQARQRQRHSRQRIPLLATGANNECLVF